MNDMNDEDASAMKPDLRPSRRDLLIGGACLITAGGAFAQMPRHRLASIPKGRLEALAPDRIGDWRYETTSGIVLPPPDELARLLYDQQVTRAYVSERHPPVMLVMAYGSSQGGMLQVHRPEICYPASGFRLTGTVTGELPIGGGRVIPVRSFTATGDTRVEQVMYWTRIADALPTSWTSQRIAIMESNLKGAVPDGLLVRLSTVGEAQDAARRTLETFAQAMLTIVGPAGRRQLLGASVA
ncbi:EpsI family protein [Sphingomonas sp. BIUV-7]|uniref:EpsI family protein n=1 Tax=Sphingomonas natans TaxID=3063330 RepID=A0ABT8Y724_9SPHN|nr:exosortase-associated protein EpsI, V-type [Sphingomonas sp. BIUV-7]MDO6413534.1 EpsI family protein [Sphingomonas sp. BIUV-7]